MPVFQHLAPYIPIKQCLKFRQEGNIGIVNNTFDFKLMYLNETALNVFGLIDGKRTIADIFEILFQEYDVQEDILESDLISIIRDFQWEKIIRLKKALRSR
jgi:hypothetical protein